MLGFPSASTFRPKSEGIATLDGIDMFDIPLSKEETTDAGLRVARSGLERLLPLVIDDIDVSEQFNNSGSHGMW